MVDWDIVELFSTRKILLPCAPNNRKSSQRVLNWSLKKQTWNRYCSIINILLSFLTTTRLPSFYIKMYVNCLFKTLNLEIMLKNYNGELVSKGNGSNGLLEQMNYTGIIVKLNIIYDCTFVKLLWDQCQWNWWKHKWNHLEDTTELYSLFRI